MDALPVAKTAGGRGMKPRSSVSAEAFGVWNKKSDFKPREVPKSDITKEKILSRLKQSFLF